jgi:hypothetical protein
MASESDVNDFSSGPEYGAQAASVPRAESLSRPDARAVAVIFVAAAGTMRG